MPSGNVERVSRLVVVMAAMLVLPGCLATKVVTVPAKVVYGAGKLAVKGTAAAIRAVVPDDEEATEASDGDAQAQAPARAAKKP